MKSDRHAFLIMAHNEFDILVEILRALDHERNEFFLHIDKKTQEYPENKLKDAIKKGTLHFIPRMNVYWGGYSQIECEIQLMRCAFENGPFDYYHMTTGAIYPVAKMSDILEFFDSHKGAEFIGFDNKKDYGSRAQYINLFNELGKPETYIDQFRVFIRNKFRGVQKRIGYKYAPTRNIEFRKGFVYWALSQEAISYILDREKWIRRIFKHSFCGDELFVQTVIYNSPLRDKVYDVNDEYKSCMHYVKPTQSWKRGFGSEIVEQVTVNENSITCLDVEDVIESGRLFAFKFVGEKGLDAIKMLQKRTEACV